VTVTGYTIKQGATGAWWVRVRRQGRRPQAWRFGTWDEAVRFADRLRSAAPAAAGEGEGEAALLRARRRSIAGRALPPADA
jgi:hypothetical protein